MNYTRQDLVQNEAVINQMRNALYHLARFMEKNGVHDLKEKFRNMGRNIARTFINYWKPIDVVDLLNVKDVLSTIYQKIVNSYVSIEINENDKLIKIIDKKCSLCKYQYEDVEIAGCEILIGLVSELVSLISKDSSNPSSIFLEPVKVVESQAYGNNSCVQLFRYKIGRSA